MTDRLTDAMTKDAVKEMPGTNGRLPPGIDRVGIAFDTQPGRIFWTICGWKDGDPPDQKWIIDCGELVIPGLSHDPSEQKFD